MCEQLDQLNLNTFNATSACNCHFHGIQEIARGSDRCVPDQCAVFVNESGGSPDITGESESLLFLVQESGFAMENSLLVYTP